MREEATWKAADVTAAVLAFMNDVGELRRTLDVDFARIRGAVGASPQLPNHLHILLSQQIMRSLDKLAGEGELIKYKKDEHLPWAKPGTRLSGPVYFTPAAHEKARAEGEEEERNRVGYIQWRERLMAKLMNDFGIDSQLESRGAHDPDKASVIIPVEGWQKLMRLASREQDYAALAYAALAEEWDRRAKTTEWGAAGLNTAAAELRKLLNRLGR